MPTARKAKKPSASQEAEEHNAVEEVKDEGAAEEAHEEDVVSSQPEPEVPSEEVPPEADAPDVASEAAPEEAPQEQPKEAPAADPSQEKDEGSEEPAEEVEPGVSLLDRMGSELSSLVGELHDLVNKLSKDRDPDERGESPEQIRLGAAQFLKEAQSSLVANRSVVEGFEAMHKVAQTEKRKLDEARDYIAAKSDDFRAQRDAFMTLHNLSEEQFHAAISYARRSAAGVDPEGGDAGEEPSKEEGSAE